MTRPILPQTPELPEIPGATVSALHALYQEGAKAEPSLMLDRRILDAARAELGAGARAEGASRPRRPAAWWKGWLPVTSAIAVAIVGLSVTWRVMDEQERHLREEMRAEQPAGEGAGRAAPAERPAKAIPAISAQAPAVEKSRRTEPALVRDVPIGVPEPETKPAPAGLAAPAAPAPMIADEAMKKVQRAEKEELRERRDARAAMEAASGPARQIGKLDAGGGAAASGEKGADSFVRRSDSAAAKSAARPAVDAATPDAWLKDIRDLRAAGRVAEAAQSLARFRARYPDFVLPDDLLNLK